MAADKISLVELFERHVLYEVWMLVETYNRLEAGVADRVVGNALIESFCIHARALVDFFNDRKGAKASSFAEPTYVSFAKGDIPDALKSKLSTQIAHLTLTRTSNPAKKIDRAARQELFLKIATELNNFLQHLKPEYHALCPSDLKVRLSSVVTPAPSSSQATNAVTTTST